MRNIKVAATQMACTWDAASNIKRAEDQVRKAHQQGAQIILLQELFETPYFCQEVDPKHFKLAKPVTGNGFIEHFQGLARELEVVLPISFFEIDGNNYFNSIVVLDADGSIVSHYRKVHIPDAVGYYEKYYFSPGDTGFQVAKTRYADIGVAICWDQWFPESARSMVLKGAEMLFYPTAIGSEPSDESLDSREHWQQVMQGHAAANMVPVIASNRIGVESTSDSSMTFYGSSFITDYTGKKVEEVDQKSEVVICASFDLDEAQEYRRTWGIFRDRRPSQYTSINHLSAVGV